MSVVPAPSVQQFSSPPHSVAGGMHHLSRRCSWQVLTEKTITWRYSTTSLRWLHDHHCAILNGLARDLGMLLTGGGASVPDVQAAPQRRRVWVLRGGAVSGRNLTHNRPSGIEYPALH